MSGTFERFRYSDSSVQTYAYIESSFDETHHAYRSLLSTWRCAALYRLANALVAKALVLVQRKEKHRKRFKRPAFLHGVSYTLYLKHEKVRRRSLETFISPNLAS